MNEYATNPIYWIIVLQGLLLLGLCAVILRQSRLLRHMEEERQWNASGFDRVQEMQRSQEKAVLGELALAAADHHKELEVLQRRLLVQVSRLYQALERRFGEMQKHIADDSGNLRVNLAERLDRLHQTLEKNLGENRVAQQEGMSRGMESIGQQLIAGLESNAKEVGVRLGSLADSTDNRLREISGQVEKRLNEGFDRTTETFSKVLEHLTRIDEAQRRITELSNNVVSLQEVLSDKRSRGAFGEVQLNSLVRNIMPESSFSLQHTLSNGNRADCVLFLPEPTGNIVVDSKFPLENYRCMTDIDAAEVERERATGRFRVDIRRHIAAIADKYIVASETADGAMMFIPAESVFAEIHAHHPELVEEAWRRHVWLASPTTMMAILTTARAALKDAATREQIDLIQKHLNFLSRDFSRFQERMERLSNHIRQANRDVEEAQLSARKISARFDRIERVELDGLPLPDEFAPEDA
ncbi:MAG: DNA recombination protein RmuC [Gammaproteobacteria bacterium]|nr:DNA recombination protein RmuC [Gammaproteobacteria bacterium]